MFGGGCIFKSVLKKTKSGRKIIRSFLSHNPDTCTFCGACIFKSIVKNKKQTLFYETKNQKTKNHTQFSLSCPPNQVLRQIAKKGTNKHPFKHTHHADSWTRHMTKKSTRTKNYSTKLLTFSKHQASPVTNLLSNQATGPTTGYNGHQIRMRHSLLCGHSFLVVVS